MRNIYKENLNFNAPPVIFEFAQENRKKMTPAELILWDALKEKKLDGWKFRKQHPMGSYILDFYCHKAKLGVELDGGYHDMPQQKEYDAKRTAILQDAGISLVRFRNEAVIQDMENVLAEILKALRGRSTQTSPVTQ